MKFSDCLFHPLALVILRAFTKPRLQNISGTLAATALVGVLTFLIKWHPNHVNDLMNLML
jgi:hypothetical protein